MALILSPENEKKWIAPKITPAQINENRQTNPKSDMIEYTDSESVNNGKNNRNIQQSMEKVDYLELSLW